MTTAFAVAISWLAAGALVIGFAWTASTMDASPPAGTPPESLPFALAWSGASLAMLASSVGSLFATTPQRRRALLGTAYGATLGLLAFVVVGLLT